MPVAGLPLLLLLLVRARRSDAQDASSPLELRSSARAAVRTYAALIGTATGREPFESRSRADADRYAATLYKHSLRKLTYPLENLLTLFEARDVLGLSAAEAQNVLGAACRTADLLLDLRADKLAAANASRAEELAAWPEQQSMRCWPVHLYDPTSFKEGSKKKDCVDLLHAPAAQRDFASPQCTKNCDYNSHQIVEYYTGGHLMYALAALGDNLAKLGRASDAARYITAVSECVYDRLFSLHPPFDAQQRVVDAAVEDAEWSWRSYMLTCDPCMNTPQAFNHAGFLAIAVDRLARAIEANGGASHELPGGLKLVERLRAVASAFVAHWQESATAVELDDGATVLRWKYRDYCLPDMTPDRPEDINHASYDVHQLGLLFHRGDNPHGLTLEYMQALMNTFVRVYVLNRSATDFDRFACDQSGTTVDEKACSSGRAKDERVLHAANWLELPNAVLVGSSASSAAIRASMAPLCAAMVTDLLPALSPLLSPILPPSGEATSHRLKLVDHFLELVSQSDVGLFQQGLFVEPGKFQIVLNLARLDDACFADDEGAFDDDASPPPPSPPPPSPPPTRPPCPQPTTLAGGLAAAAQLLSALLAVGMCLSLPCLSRRLRGRHAPARLPAGDVPDDAIPMQAAPPCGCRVFF